MNVQEFLQLVASAVGVVGVAASVAVWITKLALTKFADSLLKTHEKNLTSQLETHKAELAVANARAEAQLRHELDLKRFDHETTKSWFHRMQAEAVHSILVALSGAIRAFASCTQRVRKDEIAEGRVKAYWLGLINTAIDAQTRFRRVTDDNRHLLPLELREATKEVDRILFEGIKLNRGAKEIDDEWLPAEEEQLKAFLAGANALRQELEAYAHALLRGEENPIAAVDQFRKKMGLRFRESEDASSGRPSG